MNITSGRNGKDGRGSPTQRSISVTANVSPVSSTSTLKKPTITPENAKNYLTVNNLIQ